MGSDDLISANTSLPKGHLVPLQIVFLVELTPAFLKVIGETTKEEDD